MDHSSFFHLGEWLSVQSARELYTRQIEVKRQELAALPEKEQEELALIYQARGLDQEAAQHMARRISPSLFVLLQ